MPVREIKDLLIERWANGGDGIGVVESGDLEGLVVFVPRTVPGDRVDVDLKVKKKRWARGHVHRLISPSEFRVEPPCEFQEKCGGCPWMIGSVELQRAQLETILRAEVKKRLRIEPSCAEIEISPVVGGSSLEYRNRLRLAYRTNEGGRVELGFRQPRSGKIAHVAACAVALPELSGALGSLRDTLSKRPPEEGEVRLLGFKGVVAGSIEPRGKPAMPWGVDAVDVQISDASLRLPATAFVQGNAEIASRMADALEERARHHGGSVAVELFCGAGTFTVPLLKAGYKVWGYDIADDCGLAFKNATEGFGAAQYHQQDLLGLSPYPEGAPAKPDLVLLDPPRSGAGDVVGWISASGASCVLMVSCDLATGLRDAGMLMEAGFQCVRINSYDLFPNTGHQELIFELIRTIP